jgi:CRISPR/Cas system endoribonuclease Cas6 (RAMP superfamily)
MTFTYPLTRYCFVFEVSSPIRLPEYAGSTLRGAFGHALRQLACMTREKKCSGCMLASTCPYTTLFEPQKPTSGSISLSTPPVPYIIEPPVWGARQYAKGETLAFHFTLIGKASDHLPLCIMAWRRAFARGVGAGDGTAELMCVTQESKSSETTVYLPGEAVTEHPRNTTLTNNIAPDTVTLEFVTPLRLQENGHAIPPNRLTPRPLLTALLRRASLLVEHYDGKPLYTPTQFAGYAQAANEIKGLVNMEWRDWTRRSSRQQRTMQLGGCMGSWTLTGNLAPFWNTLQLGELLHVGKEASFGLGQYLIQSVPPQ